MPTVLHIDGKGPASEPYVCPRCGETRAEPFTWAHKPRNSGIRTCGGNPVPASQVDQARKDAAAEFRREAAKVLAAESSWS